MNVLDSPKFDIEIVEPISIDLKTLEKNFEATSEDIEHEYNPFHIQNLQNYHPIYQTFVSLSESNYDNVNFNHKYHIFSLNQVLNKDNNEVISKPVFIKYSPLLDPVRYMIGKYKINEQVIILPKPLDIIIEPKITNIFTKIMDPNNASYTDNFFSYLTSCLLHQHKWLHGVDYYGSFIGIQDKFKMNITDDLEYLNTSKYFNENKNQLFSLTKCDELEFNNFGSRANKNRLCINKTPTDNILLDSIIDLGCSDIDELDNDTNIIVENIENIDNINPYDKQISISTDELVYEKSTSSDSDKTESSCSTSSSNNSETNYSSDSDDDSDSDSSTSDNDEESNSEDDNWQTESELSEEQYQYAYINNFPVQLICLEKCDGTIDDLFLKNEINDENGASAFFQIIMTLIAYQKAFHFTHNDLHTNNIMYINTDIEFLYYRYNKQMYRIPTYGKLYKLIDFGRSIYRFNGNLFCSDSFNTGGDAATQYNCEPYMNEDKPRLDPNYSFDLSRLGCSIYDFIIDDDEDPKQFTELQKTIYRWCLDDNKKNLLYKKDGDERYPNFKLYKMIARTTHEHTPQEQLEFPFFKQFLLSKREVSKLNDSNTTNMMNIDALPCYV